VQFVQQKDVGALNGLADEIVLNRIHGFAANQLVPRFIAKMRDINHSRGIVRLNAQNLTNIKTLQPFPRL